MKGFKNLTKFETKKTLEKIKQILNNELKPWWVRDQNLHDTAYEIVERMIEKEFKPPDCEIHHINLDDPEVYFDHQFNHPNYVMGYIEFLRKICSWKKPYGSELPLHLEVEYILKCKEKKIMKLMKESVFDEKTTFEQCMYKYI